MGEGTRLSTEQVVHKRLVLHHATGKLAGIHQIVGYLEGTAQQVADAIDPSFFYPANRKHKAVHHKTAPRFVLYREWAQAHNDFNPAQR